MVRKLGSIFIELTLNDTKFKEGVARSKSAAESAGKDIEKIALTSQQKQLKEYDKFIADKDKATQRSVANAIKADDNLKSSTLSSLKSFNQQQLKEVMFLENERLKNLRAGLALQTKEELANRKNLLSSLKADIMERSRIQSDANKQAYAQASKGIDAARLMMNQSLKPKDLSLPQSNVSPEQSYAQLTRGIEAAKHAYNQSLGPQKIYMQNMIETSKHVIQAAPGYAIATAAIASVYVALRAVRDEFVAGLAAVEDYQIKVASMSAFLTTFNKSLTKENIGQVFQASNREAERVVKTMEKLDAKTIATGKDLTTMAEQFIKGGVKIDTVNKGSLNGFTNIANALKLLTQGQNQEIQMRQEIRALVQGQLKDTNILAKTLESIDPNIKEHIKLWREEGTLIENVGSLLAGFGPAAKELEKTWAIVGTTMETIHTRILRGAFKPTYDSLIDTAKAWNRLLMDSNGNLTPLANTLSKILELSLAIGGALFKGILATSIALAVGGAAYGAWTGFGLIIASITGGIGAMSAAFTAFTIAMYKNPYFAVGAIVITTAFGFLIKQYIEDLGKVKNEINSVGAAAEENLLKYTQAREKSDQIMGRIEPTPIGDAGINIVPYIPGTLSQSTVEELVKPLKKYTDELQNKATKEKDSARATLEAKIANGEFAQSFKLLSNGGAAANSTLEETVALARKYASAIDSKKFVEQSRLAIEKLQGVADSLRVKDSALDRSKASEISALLSTTEYRKALAMTGDEGKKLAGTIMSLAVAYDESKAQESATKTLENYILRLKEKVVVLKGGKSALEEHRIEEGKISEAFEKAGEKGDEYKNIIKELGEEYSKLVDDNELDKLQSKLDKLKVSILPEKEENKIQKLRNELDGLVEDYAKLGKDILPEVANLYKELNERGTDWIAGATYGLRQYAKDSNDVFKTAENVVTKAFKGMEDALVEFVKTGKIGFTDMVDSMASELIRLSIQKSITGPLATAAASFLPSLFGVSANGNIFNQNGFQKFANGGAFTNSIVSSPTIFPFANGTGLMGEAGPEAIMPLQRNSSGKLGVIASGGGGAVTNVIINNNTSAKATTSETQNSSGGKDITVMIDEVVGNLIMSGRGKTNKAMRSTFGANPILAGR